MRYLKVLALVILFFVSMVFFIQNTPELSKEVTLSMALLDFKFTSQPLPYYLLILVAFCAGSFICLFYFMADKIRLSGQLRTCRTKMSNLEQEVNSLRNLPLDEKNYPSADESDDKS
ncbi:putative membrane protein [Maridesulfovibrio ferrireducens]|uniref:Putative membrane protein n=1 Tax=Maridesulfovibrio ferrireducens TaxID=246191 RepID=A0A1G9I3E4_9BACT|nr:LapA family protein [Maridesulfovibrio ferrireducens]SDL19751.1 putative membrane protein [Maridesulfovibrio ferrireducens]